MVMKELISCNQSTFLKNMHIIDRVVVINEVVDWAKKKGKECIIFKVDFEKAYDSVSWSFLEYMLGRFGFAERWIA